MPQFHGVIARTVRLERRHPFAVHQPGAMGADKTAWAEFAFHAAQGAAHQKPPPIREEEFHVISRR